MDLIERLRRVPLFEQLSEENLRRVARVAEERTVPAGTRLCWQADRGTTFFIIDSGEAKIHHIDERGYQRPVSMLRGGDSFGTTSLFLSEPRDATVIAVTEMHLWTIQRADFQSLLSEEPLLRRELQIPEAIMARLRAPRYPWLEPDERVIRQTRRHWVVFGRSIFLTTLAVFAYVAFVIWLAFYARLSLDVLLLILPVFALASLGFVWHWFDWHNDYFVVTNRRITHHEQVAFLYESRDETHIERVQDIVVQRSGLGKLLDYGDITIQTAARIGSIAFRDAPSPDDLREAIFNELSRVRAMRRASQRRQVRGELISHIAAETPELPLQVMADQQTLIDQVEESEIAEPEPGKFIRAVIRLAEMGFLPRTRIEKPDSITWRKHWIFLLVDVAPSFVLGLVLGMVTVMGFFGRPAWLVAFLPSYPFVTLFFTLIAIGWFWWQSTDWANDLYILTKDRIIDVEKRPLFLPEQQREASLGAIQNVTLRIPSPMAVLFNYGDVTVQTAAAGEFTFDGAPNPRAVQQEIFRRVEAFQEAQREAEAARRRAELAEWFAVYDELHRQGKRFEPPLLRGASAPGSEAPEGDQPDDSARVK
jgi:membrane protein YdbS with pleckstrin-like domain